MSKIYTALEKCWSLRYFILPLFFILMLMVFEENSLWNNYVRYRENEKLRVEVEKYKAEYESYNAALLLLDTDYNEVERVAREQHLMKRPNEDVFVFTQQTVTE